jgi:hypothetical protein
LNLSNITAYVLRFYRQKIAKNKKHNN